MTKKKKKKSYLWLYLLLAGLIGALVMVILWKNKGKSDGIKVQVENVEKRTIKELVSASGRIYPEVEVKISSDVSGEVVELYVEEGDSVTVGQLLCKVDPEAFQSSVERVQATVDNAKSQVANAKAGLARSEAALQQSIAQKKQIEAQLENARTIFRRNEQLLKDGVISQADYDNAQSSLRSFEANLESAVATVRSAEAGVEASRQTIKASEFSVKSAEASLKETRTSLNRTSIYAPMSGVISMMSVEKGERVVGTIQMTGTEIMRIANLSSMEVQVDVSENDVLRVNLKDEVNIEVDAYLDRTFTGKVTEIANSAANTTGINLTNDQVTNFTVKIRIDRASYNDLLKTGSKFPFRPGMSASVEINTNTRKDILTVPIQAVTTREKDEEEKESDDLNEVVFVVKGDTVEQRIVKTGIQDDEFIEVLSGLEDAEEIVKGPYSAVSKKLESGEKIEKTDDKKDGKGSPGWGG